MMTHTTDADTAPAELAPVELDPPSPAIARWLELADTGLLIEHDGDAERVNPFPRPAWADPDADEVGKSICSTWYNSDYAYIPLSHMGGESQDGAIMPSRITVRGRLCGDGWRGVGISIVRLLDNKWTAVGCTMTLAEARDLINVLTAATDMIGGDQ